MELKDFLRQTVRLYTGSFGYLITRLLPLLLIAGAIGVPNYGHTAALIGAWLAGSLVATYGTYLLIRHYLPELSSESSPFVGTLVWLILAQLYVGSVNALLVTLFMLPAARAGDFFPLVSVLLIIPVLFVYAVTLFHPVLIVRWRQTTFAGIGSSVELARGCILKLMVGVGILFAVIYAVAYGVNGLWDEVVGGTTWGFVRDAILGLLDLLVIAGAATGYRLLNGDQNYRQAKALVTT